MSVRTRIPLFKKLLTFGPIILLFISVLNEFDFNYLNYEYFTFNFENSSSRNPIPKELTLTLSEICSLSHNEK